MNSIHGTNGISTYMNGWFYGFHGGKIHSHMDDMEMDLLQNGWKTSFENAPKGDLVVFYHGK